MIQQLQLFDPLLGKISSGKHAPVTPCSFPLHRNCQIDLFFDWMRYWVRDAEVKYDSLNDIIEALVEGKLFIPSKRHCDAWARESLDPIFEDVIIPIEGHKDRAFTKRISNSTGMHILLEQRGNMVYDMKFEWSGSACSIYFPRNDLRLPIGLMYYLMIRLPRGKWSRLDTTFECDRWLLPMREMKRCLKRGDYSGAKTKSRQCSELPGSDREFWTYIIGSKNTRTKKVRVYETLPKHGYDRVRLEVQSGGVRAVYLSQILVSYAFHPSSHIAYLRVPKLTNNSNQVNVKKLNMLVAGMMVDQSVVGFYTPTTGKKHRTYKERVFAPFWNRFIGYLHCESWKIRFHYERPDVSSTVNYLIRNCMGILVDIEAQCGREYVDVFISSLMQIAKSRRQHTVNHCDSHPHLRIFGELDSFHLVQALHPALQQEIAKTGFLRLLGQIGRSEPVTYISSPFQRKTHLSGASRLENVSTGFLGVKD